MVSHETFLKIHRRLNEIKGVDEGIFFGNLNVIALGDLFQLPPVPPGQFVFETKPEVCLFDLILYVPSTIFQLNRDGSSWVEPVLS